MDWIITIPKVVPWEVYQEELEAVDDETHVMNYKVNYFPKEMEIGDRCYILWNGKVRGWMEIVGKVYKSESWICETTGAEWPAGKYIQRSGVFHAVDGPYMKGFRGIRKYSRAEKEG